MPVKDTTEKRFESDIEAFFLSEAGGCTKGMDEYDPKAGLYHWLTQVKIIVLLNKT